MGRILAVTEYDEVEPACTTVRTIDPVMNHSECKTIVPILTVMVDYGNAPFLWLVDKPDEGGLLIRHGLLQSPDAVQLVPVEALRHLSPSKVDE